MAQIHAIFPTLISIENLEEFKSEHQKMYKKILEWKEKYPSKRKWNCYTTIGHELESKDSLFQRLIQVCTEKVQNFAKEIDVSKNITLYSIWSNINGPGHSQEFHTHPESVFSAVYYIKVNEDSGNVQFLKPSEMFGKCTLGNLKTRQLYQPHEGDFVIFTSDTPHRVLLNRSNEDRVSLAMNFNIK